MTRPARSLQRLERVLTMVPWLLEHPGVRLAEVAERFGATPEEVAKDLDVLGYCGLPGYGGGDLVEASVIGDRVSVRMADFFRRPLSLSLREALTLLLAARALAGVEELPESPALHTAIAKLEAALSQGKSTPSLADVRLAIDLTAPGDEHLPVLRAAVAQRQVVRLTYRSASKAQTTEREVEPWTVVSGGGAWYLQGWCRLASGPRDFRLDRIAALSVTDEVVDEVPSEPPPPPVYRPRPGDVEAVLDLEPGAWWVLDWAVIDAVEERGDVRRVHLRAKDLEWVARLVLRLGGQARVLAPEGLAERVRALATDALARY